MSIHAMKARGAAAGEEFRDDVRRKLPPEVLAPLTELAPLRSTLAVAHTFGSIALELALAVTFWSVAAAIIAIILTAPLQHALFILAHDAAHYRLYRTRWLNDLIGRLAGTLGGIPMCAYRVIHRLHHNHLYQAQDPDIALHGGYPRGKAYLLKKLGKDLCGLTAWKTYAYFFGRLRLTREPMSCSACSTILHRNCAKRRGRIAGSCWAFIWECLWSPSPPGGGSITSCYGWCRSPPVCRRFCD